MGGNSTPRETSSTPQKGGLQLTLQQDEVTSAPDRFPYTGRWVRSPRRGLGSLPSTHAKLSTLNCTGLNRRPRCITLNRSLTRNSML